MKSRRTLVLCLAFGLMAIPLTAQLAPQARLEALRPTYEALRDSAEHQRFERAIAERGHGDEKLIDEYLRFLPISPLDMLEIDMRANRYEFVIPRFIAEWHARWIAFHEDLAREMYGDEHVDSRLAAWPVDTGNDATATRATVDTNRNAASTFSPSPLDYQGEIQIAVNHNNPNQIVAAANTWDTIGGTCAGGIQAVFYSSDGGVTWGYTCPPVHTAYSLGSCSGTVFGSDPALAWNDNNEVFLNHMMICFISNNNTQYAMVVARSANGGANWSAQGVIRNSWGSTTLEDKNFYVVDTNTSSPFYGRHYTCWDRSNNEKMAYSSNNGATWTEVDLPTPPGGGFDLGCDLAVEDDGTVHIVFNTLTCGASCSNERMFYTRSTNGGASWSSATLVRDFNLVAFSNNSCPDVQDERCIGPFGGIAVDNSGGACDGTLYATFSDFTSGNGNNSDVWVSRSTNNGVSWGAPVRVNDDTGSNAQFHPFVQVDQSNGGAVVGWHDARNDPGNDAVDYYVTRSMDCGLSFETNIQASQPSSEFNNSGISFSNENSVDNPNNNPNQYGEYMGVDALDGKAYLAWVDTRHFFPGSSTNNQKENLGFAVVDFGGATGPVCGNNVIEGTEVCDGTALGGQNCANFGFNSGTLACNGSCSAFDTSGCFNVGGGGTKIWMSFRNNASIPGVGTVTDEDIVSYDESAGTWALEFDGSDVGLGGLEISGLAVLPGGDLLLSFTAAGTVDGLAVDDSDIVRFTPTSLGATTAGSFTVYFDGSDVGLTQNAEDIDAIALASDGRLIISGLGTIRPSSGVNGPDEDLLIFTGTLGANTSGSFARHFDGSDVALNNSGSEDVDAATLTAGGNLLFSTVGTFSVAGLTADDEDVAEFSGTFGNSTSGTFSLRLDLSALGIDASEDIGSLHIEE